MTTCIREWYSVWTSCRCDTCRRGRIRYRKLHAAGLAPRVSSEDAWAVLDRMIARGWTPAAIASACGLTSRSAHSLLEEGPAERRRVIGAVISAKIVGHGAPSHGYVGVIGARRKVRALARLGHTEKVIGDAGGIGFTTVASIRRGETERISPRIAAAVDQAWVRLWKVDGVSDIARGLAAAQGWPSPMAWDDIDDPHENPKGTLTDIERDKAILRLAAAGSIPADIAVEIGCWVRTVERVLGREAA